MQKRTFDIEKPLIKGLSVIELHSKENTAVVGLFPNL